jgi:hypothetical protein
MSKTFTLCLVLLLSAAWLQAQYSQSSSSQAGAGSSGETTVQGCLQGSSGSFTITDNSGMTYQLQGDTSKLADHVNHEVQIKGSVSASAGSSSAAGGAAGAASQPQALDVKSVKMVSQTCKSAGK